MVSKWVRYYDSLTDMSFGRRQCLAMMKSPMGSTLDDIAKIIFEISDDFISAEDEVSLNEYEIMQRERPNVMCSKKSDYKLGRRVVNCRDPAIPGDLRRGPTHQEFQSVCNLAHATNK